MFKLIKVALAALIVTTSAAQAGEHSDNSRLWNAVTELVDIYKDDRYGACSNDSGLFGLYYPDENFMVICDGLSYDDFYETLRHETMHLIQDCNAGIYNDSMQTTFSHSSLLRVETHRTQVWLSGYDDISWEDRMLESEAFHYEMFGSDVVLDLLNERC